jgi:hypothetical protein
MKATHGAADPDKGGAGGAGAFESDSGNVDGGAFLGFEDVSEGDFWHGVITYTKEKSESK